MRLSAKHFTVLGAGFAGLELCYTQLVRLQNLREHAAAFLCWIGLALLFFFLIVAWLRRNAAVLSGSRGLLLASLAAAVVFRLTLFGLTPTLSEDIYRYVWDGRVQQAGINPYAYAPIDPALAPLRTFESRLINHPDIATIYPPLTQFAFRAGAAIGPTLWSQKFIFVMCDLAIIALLMWWLPQLGIPALMSLIYAWHPLAVVEVAGSGHNDPLGIAWLLIGLIAWQSRRQLEATSAFALAFLSKFATLLLWPFYAVRARRWLVVFLGLVLLGGWWARCSPHLSGTSLHYGADWECNSSLYLLLRVLWRSALAARLTAVVALAGYGVRLAIRCDDLIGYTLRMLQAAVLLAPVVEPWYVLWLLPLLCLRFSWGWLVFSGAVMASYAVQIEYVAHGIWRIPLWARWAAYGQLYAWLVWQGIAVIRRGRQPA